MKYLLLLVVSVCLLACSDSKPAAANETALPAENQPVAKKIQPSEGCFLGAFEADKYRETEVDYYLSNKITLCVDRIAGDSVFGHSVVAGNSRPFRGIVTEKSEVNLTVVAQEPGDDPYDGAFKFVLIPGSDSLAGIWEANNQKLAVYQRKYSLERRVFSYDPQLDLPERVKWNLLYGTGNPYADAGEFLTEAVTTLNPSKEKLTVSQVENMYRGDLEVIRNSIYARHGYSFKNRKMRYVFDHVDWYMPYSVDVRDQFTPLEKENIALISRYEAHAARYYDSFGR